MPNPSTLMQGDYDAAGVASITNLRAPKEPGDAVNLGYVQSLKGVFYDWQPSIDPSPDENGQYPKMPIAKAGQAFPFSKDGFIGHPSGDVTQGAQPVEADGDFLYCIQDNNQEQAWLMIPDRFMILPKSVFPARTDRQGTVSLATSEEIEAGEGDGVITAGQVALLGLSKSFETLLANPEGLTELTVQHDLDVNRPRIEVWAGNREVINFGREVIDSNNVKLTFMTAPPDNAYLVIVR